MLGDDWIILSLPVQFCCLRKLVLNSIVSYINPPCFYELDKLSMYLNEEL
jgi:hypothetical protein